MFPFSVVPQTLTQTTIMTFQFFSNTYINTYVYIHTLQKRTIYIQLCNFAIYIHTLQKHTIYMQLCKKRAQRGKSAYNLAKTTWQKYNVLQKTRNFATLQKLAKHIAILTPRVTYTLNDRLYTRVTNTLQFKHNS